MFRQLLPQRIDNSYRGHKLALWLFGLIVLMKSAMSVNSILLGHKVATSADGIPWTHSRSPPHRRYLLCSRSGACPFHDLPALYPGFVSISRAGSLHVFISAAGASG